MKPWLSILDSIVIPIDHFEANSIDWTQIQLENNDNEPLVNETWISIN